MILITQSGVKLGVELECRYFHQAILASLERMLDSRELWLLRAVSQLARGHLSSNDRDFLAVAGLSHNRILEPR